jgi:hypothetical protein
MLILAAGLLTLTSLQAPAAPPVLTRDEMATFLRTAKVVKSKDLGKGITIPQLLTLSDGHVTHDAVFKTVDEHKPVQEFAGGKRELNFIDSWRYDVAAFRLAELIGLGEMMPVTVERKWQGHSGALSWWIDKLMDEDERYKKKMEAPDPEAWNKQMWRLRVFSELVDDTDRNLGNVIITPEWKLFMIDFTRAFRLWAKIKEANITKCDRRLLESLETLSLDALSQATKGYLSGAEAKAVMSRRDLIVAHVKKLVSEKGEAAVLY